MTSPKQSDGKSTVAANLAAAIAIGGQAVTLIDGDLRRPTVAGLARRSSTVPASPTSWSGGVTPGEVMQEHPDVPGLRVLASGAIPPNPSELLGSKAMQTLVSDLARDAMVIIDAPPLLPVTDAAVLTRSADGAIVVIAHDGTLDSELAAALDTSPPCTAARSASSSTGCAAARSSGFYGGDYYRYEYKPNIGRRKHRTSAPGRRRRPRARRAAAPAAGRARPLPSRADPSPVQRRTPTSSRASSGVIG